MPLGLAPLTVGRPAASVLVAAAAAAGCERVGMTLWPPEAELSALCRAPGLRRALRAQLDGSGVSVLDVGVIGVRPSLSVDATERLIEAAADLGADRLLAMNWDREAHRAADTLAAVCAAAEPADLRVGLEFAPYTATRTIGEAAALASAAGATNAGVVLDVLHLFRSGGSAADLRTLPPGIVHLVQLCDGRAQAPAADRLRAEALTDRRYPGEGEFPLLALLRALPPEAPVTVEAPVLRDRHRTPAERARAAVTATRELLAAAGHPGAVGAGSPDGLRPSR